MAMQSLRHKPHDRRALAAVVLFVLALLLAQTLGFAHRVLHRPHAAGQGGQFASMQAVPAQFQSAAGAQVKPHGHLAGLFQHNDQDPTCRIFDQAGSADSLVCVPAVTLPMALSSYVLLYFQGEVLARWVALFDARGPPSVR